MPPEEFGRALSFGGNEQGVIDYYKSIFNNPAIMSTNVDYPKVVDTLPITPTSIQDFAGIYREYLSCK